MYVQTIRGLGQEARAIEVDRAVRLNRFYAGRLGWGADRGQIARLLGFTNFTPDDQTFAEAVALWQSNQPGLTVDGIIGPSSWRRMQTVLTPRPLPSPPPPPVTPAGLPPLGTFARVQHEVDQILVNPAEARRWGAPGSLLSNGVYRLKIQHPAPGAANRFRRYSGLGSNKCNVFALDVAWRSGFRVPLLNIGSVSRPRYSYPLANSLTTYAERAYHSGDMTIRGRDGTQWGWVGTHVPATVLNDKIAQGHMLILAGWRRSGTGHVGIIRRIAYKSEDTGPIRDITFDGWEATSKAARALTGRRWRTDQCGRLTGGCRRDPGNSMRVFCAIHIIGLTAETDPARRGVLSPFTKKCRLS